MVYNGVHIHLDDRHFVVHFDEAGKWRTIYERKAAKPHSWASPILYSNHVIQHRNKPLPKKPTALPNRILAELGKLPLTRAPGRGMLQTAGHRETDPSRKETK